MAPKRTTKHTPALKPGDTVEITARAHAGCRGTVTEPPTLMYPDDLGPRVRVSLVVTDAMSVCPLVTDVRRIEASTPLRLSADAAVYITDELDRIAADIERRSDNVPMTADGRGVERVGTLREIAEKIRARATEIRGGAS